MVEPKTTRTLWFTVDPSGILHGDDLEVAQDRADAFGVDQEQLQSLPGIAEEATECEPLQRFLVGLLAPELEGENEPHEVLLAYLKVGYVAERGPLIKAVQKWASEPPDDHEVVYADWPLNSRDAAFQYFRDNDEEASLVGVEVVPLSQGAVSRTSGVATMRWAVDAANEAAERLGRPERFRQVDTASPTD